MISPADRGSLSRGRLQGNGVAGRGGTNACQEGARAGVSSPEASARAVSPLPHAFLADASPGTRRGRCLELADGMVVADTVGENRGGGGPDGDYLPCERCAESALEGAGFGG